MENLERALTLKEDEDKGITDDSVPDVTQTENGPAETLLDSHVEKIENDVEYVEKVEEAEVVEKVEENGQNANTEPEQRDSESDNQDEVKTNQNNGLIEVGSDNTIIKTILFLYKVSRFYSFSRT